MNDWTAGYVADIGYTYGYYPELNPARVQLALLNAGIVVPALGSACELGFGQGVSINFHAAGSNTRWYGTDFNPAQAGFAQSLAAQSGADVRLFDDAFADFAQRDELPEFDYIGLHGIWSWISDENRAVIVDIVRRKLKVGGVLYVSYNTQPGWASFMPMRELLNEHAQVMGADGHGIVPRIDAALSFAQQLMDTQPAYARANPKVAERLKKLQEQNRNYLANEYFNRDWHPMSFSRMAEWLAPAKLNFACSAHYLDHLDVVNLSEAQQQMLKDIPDPMFRQSVRDFMVNTQFRRDYWVKGARTLSPLARTEALRTVRVVLHEPRESVALTVQSSRGEISLMDEIYRPVLDALADHQVRSLGELEKMLRSQGVSLAHLVQAVLLLVGKGDVSVAQDAVDAPVTARVADLNAHVLREARGSNNVGYLLSPVTGGGVPVNRFQQLFLLALHSGHETASAQAAFAWKLLAAQGQRLAKDGNTLESDTDNLAELTQQAEAFQVRLPILRAFGIL